jgi:flavodoxin I
MVAVIYGSSTLNTEFAAQRIARAFGAEVADLHNVREVDPEILKKRSAQVLVTSTWGAGDLQDDWEAFLPVFEEIDYSGKTVGLVGLGDQENYPDAFCDSIFHLYERVLRQGAKVVGATSTDGYTFSHSRAARGTRFIGLVLDEDNQSDLSDGRIRDWVSQVRTQLQG